jgi:hypothetical protein
MKGSPPKTSKPRPSCGPVRRQRAQSSHESEIASELLHSFNEKADALENAFKEITLDFQAMLARLQAMPPGQ